MMATLVDETMESYVYPSYNPYSYRYQPPKGKGGGGGGGGGPWRPRGGYFSGYGESAAVAAAAAAAEYFDNYQRAQLKAILSQVNPNLTPRLRKANTKEVGVQVNPRQDASVQCSLGPRPLLLRRRGAEQEQGSPVTGSARPVRFPRTIAVYSPVASRRLTTFLEEPEPPEPPAAQAPHRQPPARDADDDPRGDNNPEARPAEPHEHRQPPGEEGDEASSPPAEKGDLPDKPREPAGETPEEKRGQDGGVQAAGKPASHPPEEGGQSKTRVRFQVYFRQFCRTCQKSYNPYRVEDITCQSCKQTRCTCPVKLRHVDPKRPHRQDLCGRCKGKRLSCDSTFSFKYII
uniref:Zygote arrest protein 1 isoform X2 n=1 Tax=Pogona vitticeps TaxID=103695 RepID=A0ABM5GI97_9SAUR